MGALETSTVSNFRRLRPKRRYPVGVVYKVFREKCLLPIMREITEHSISKLNCIVL
jgi:hypothetical protein